MRVTIVSDVLGNENNGTSIACMNLVRFLKSQGHKVNIICADQDKIGKEGYFVVPNLHLGPLIDWMLKNNQVTLAKPDKKVIEEGLKDADVCHIMMPFALGKAALKICKAKNIPVTAGFHVQAENFTAHLLLLNSWLANHLTYLNFYHSFYKNVDIIHYPTKFIKDYFEKDVRKTTNGRIISNGVNDAFKQKNIKRKDNLFQILFIGRYSPEKSHSVLLKAVAKSKYKDQIRVVFAGDGPERKRLISMTKRFGIKNYDYSFYSRDELIDVINSTDLYVHPSKIEIEAISCLEAISCGVVPVIADSKRCATKAFALDYKNLFKCQNSKELAKRIDFWYENPDMRKVFSKKYLNFAGKFDQKTCMKKMEEMLFEAIKMHEK